MISLRKEATNQEGLGTMTLNKVEIWEVKSQKCHTSCLGNETHQTGITDVLGTPAVTQVSYFLYQNILVKCFGIF